VEKLKKDYEAKIKILYQSIWLANIKYTNEDKLLQNSTEVEIDTNFFIKNKYYSPYNFMPTFLNIAANKNQSSSLYSEKKENVKVKKQDSKIINDNNEDKSEIIFQLKTINKFPEKQDLSISEIIIPEHNVNNEALLDCNSFIDIDSLINVPKRENKSPSTIPTRLVINNNISKKINDFAKATREKIK